MLNKHHTAALLVAFVVSGALLTTGAGAFQSARAQTNSTGLFGTLASFKDQIVKGGSHIADQVTKGGVGFLSTIAANVPNVRVHFDTTYQDMVKNDKTGEGTQLKQLYANFLNDSETVYGLGQELNQLAQSKSTQTDSHTKQIISAVGTDLKNIALGSGKSNSTGNNSTLTNSTKTK